MLVSSLATGPRSDSNLRGGFFLFEGILHRYIFIVNMGKSSAGIPENGRFCPFQV